MEEKKLCGSAAAPPLLAPDPWVQPGASASLPPHAGLSHAPQKPPWFLPAVHAGVQPEPLPLRTLHLGFCLQRTQPGPSPRWPPHPGAPTTLTLSLCGSAAASLHLPLRRFPLPGPSTPRFILAPATAVGLPDGPAPTCCHLPSLSVVSTPTLAAVPHAD